MEANMDKKYEDMSLLEFLTDVIYVIPTKEQVKLINMFEELKGKEKEVVYHFPKSDVLYKSPTLNDIKFRGGVLDIDTVRCPTILC